MMDRIESGPTNDVVPLFHWVSEHQKKPGAVHQAFN
jgi:hypothetical protein